MKIIIVGPDEHGLGQAFSDRSATVVRIEGLASSAAFRNVGIADADIVVLTDVDQATAIPVARELNSSVTVVVYADASLPEFARPIADYIINPGVLDPSIIADELH